MRARYPTREIKKLHKTHLTMVNWLLTETGLAGRGKPLNTKTRSVSK